MFEQLQDRFDKAFKKIRGIDKLNEKNISDSLREVRLSLLEADVNYKVVKDFINNVKEKSLGQLTIKSVKPGQQIVKNVQDELVSFLGGQAQELELKSKDSVAGILVCGLQGSGKTTTVAKLAKFLIENKGSNPLLIAADTQRPAAIEQLQTLGDKLNIEVYADKKELDPAKVCARAKKIALDKGCNLCIYDTAGRLHIDQELMDQLVLIEKAVMPQEKLLVVDSMMGQDAVKVAESFAGILDLSGIILTKTDGDQRGGAALSMKAATNKPIKFVGTGEKIENFEMFHPDRMASRILGMGDIVTVVEKAQDNLDTELALKMEKKIKEQSFNLEDFLHQMQQIKQMGPLQDVLGMMPGMKQMKGLNIDDKQLVHVEAVIQSMTTKERKNPHIIDGSRRRRIARGSGTNTQQVNQLLKQFMMMKKIMKNMGAMQKKLGGFKLPI